MIFKCEPVGIDFIKTAPFKFVNVVDLDASPAAVFDILADGESWVQWFKEIQDVDWTSPEPKGVGTTRTVTLDSVTVDEYFLIWEPAKRFTFRFTGASKPLFKAGLEDYLMEDLGEGRTRFTYAVYLKPVLLLRLLAPLTRLIFGRMFKAGAAGLQRYVATTGS